MKLPIFVIPLIAVSCLLAVLGPQFSSDWTSFFDKYASIWTSETEDFHSNTTAVGKDQQNQPLFDHSVSNHSVFSSSSSSPPPPPIDEIQSLQQLPNRTTVNEGLEETAVNEVRNASSESSNESVVKGRRQREYSKLEKIEAGLRRARAAIKEAKFQNQTQDPDFVPTGPMYWNAKAFHR